MEPTLVRICAQCQREFGLTPAVEKANKEQGIKFSHGMCPRHIGEFWKATQKDIPSITDADIQQKIENAKKDQDAAKLDLSNKPELVQHYKNGIFTPEQLQKTQELPIAAESLHEKWKRVNKVLGR